VKKFSVLTACLLLVIITASGVYWHQEGIKLYAIHDRQIQRYKEGHLVITSHFTTKNTGSKIKGEEVMNIPYGGYVLEFLRQPVALIALVYLPAMLIAGAEVKKMIRQKNQPYRIARYL
jgi:hypothetical protein